MNIVKIIVDEYPMSCFYCPFLRDNIDGRFCGAAFHGNGWMYELDQHDWARPEWCPMEE